MVKPKMTKEMQVYHDIDRLITAYENKTEKPKVIRLSMEQKETLKKYYTDTGPVRLVDGDMVYKGYVLL